MSDVLQCNFYIDNSTLQKTSHTASSLVTWLIRKTAVRFVIELMSITVTALYKGKLEGKLGLYEEKPPYHLTQIS